MFRADEMVLHRAIELSEEGIVEPLHVQQAARFSVEAELGPGQDFAELVECPKATRQGNEGVRQVGHESLAFVHRLDDAQVADAAMREFLVHQGLRNNTDDFAALGQRGVGNDTHQSDVAAAINEPESAPGDNAGQVTGGGGKCGIIARTGAAKDADPLHAAEIRQDPGEIPPLVFWRVMAVALIEA